MVCRAVPKTCDVKQHYRCDCGDFYEWDYGLYDCAENSGEEKVGY